MRDALGREQRARVAGTRAISPPAATRPPSRNEHLEAAAGRAHGRQPPQAAARRRCRLARDNDSRRRRVRGDGRLRRDVAGARGPRRAHRRPRAPSAAGGRRRSAACSLIGRHRRCRSAACRAGTRASRDAIEVGERDEACARRAPDRASGKSVRKCAPRLSSRTARSPAMKRRRAPCWPGRCRRRRYRSMSCSVASGLARPAPCASTPTCSSWSRRSWATVAARSAAIGGAPADAAGLATAARGARPGRGRRCRPRRARRTRRLRAASWRPAGWRRAGRSRRPRRRPRGRRRWCAPRASVAMPPMW